MLNLTDMDLWIYLAAGVAGLFGIIAIIHYATGQTLNMLLLTLKQKKEIKYAINDRISDRKHYQV